MIPSPYYDENNKCLTDEYKERFRGLDIASKLKQFRGVLVACQHIIDGDELPEVDCRVDCRMCICMRVCVGKSISFCDYLSNYRLDSYEGKKDGFNFRDYMLAVEVMDVVNTEIEKLCNVEVE